MTNSIFFTGTDTEVGKTVVSMIMVHTLVERGYRVAAMKPVASGCTRTIDGLRNDDALKLIASSNIDLAYEQVNPYAFEPAIAPHLAAREVGTEIKLDHIRRSFRALARTADWIVVEGVGGWLVPLGKHFSVADLAAKLGGYVILVVAIRLGCINHALLSIESMQKSGVHLIAWIANMCHAQSDRAEENIATLEDLIPVPRMATVPFLPAPGRANKICFNLDLLNL